MQEDESDRVRPGVYRICRIDHATGRSRVIAHFVITSDGRLTFPTHADGHHGSVLQAGPLTSYTLQRIRSLLRSAEGTAGTHIQKVSQLV